MKIESPSWRGFTLLEVMVALAILALVLSITYASFSAITSRVDQARKVAGIYQTARVVMDRLFLDLTGAYLPDSASREDDDFLFQFVPADSESGMWEKFVFTSTSHLAVAPEERGLDICRISYQLKKDPQGEGFLLYRLDEPLFMYRGGEDRAPAVFLGQGFTRFELVFYDDRGRPFRQWDSTEDEFEDQLPARVSVFFTLKDEGGLEYPFSCAWPLPSFR